MVASNNKDNGIVDLRNYLALDGTKFGHAMLPEFQLDPKLKHFNNGSYGTVPKSVRKQRLEYLDQIESHPDKYILEIIPDKLESNLKLVGEYLNCDSKDITFVSNATQAANIVLKSYSWKAGDTLLCFSTTYKAVALTVQYLVDTYSINTVVVEDDGIDPLANLNFKLEELEQQNIKVKLSIVDTISSIPGLILPYQAIINSLHKHNIEVMVDGAHAFGSIDIDLQAMGAEYFFSNLHKWGYCYRPTAVLYVNPKRHNLIQPTITSYGYNTPTLRERFVWPGTIDFSVWLASEASFEFRNRFGDKNIKTYLHELAWQGGNLVANYLDVEVMGTKEQVSSMINIPLVSKSLQKDYLNDQEDLEQVILKQMMEKYNCRVKVFKFNEIWYIRLSAQIFLSIEDFDFVGKSLKSLLENL